MKTTPCLWLVCWVAGWILPLAESVANGQAAVVNSTPTYNRDIRPLLSDRCFKCHGPDEKNRQAGLRLDIESIAKEPADSGQIPIVPGQPDTSELVRRVTSTNPDEMMPPPDSKLSPWDASQLATLRAWIAEGAPWQNHWAFMPIRRPDLPTTKSTTFGWNDHPVDRFILADLQAQGLEPAPEATREELIRRVTFDLTGLPPTREEVQRFVSDTRPDSYHRLVDQLLASPRFGEHLAAFWLDVSRYADSYGYQVDRERRVWPWRDWVIHAWNQNLPFDQFVTWQLAGDLLPQATDEQFLATTFCRLHSQESEGGSVEAEYRTEYVADRTHTFATAFLGLTMECARCHDHKYDPISQREYYQLFAFFNNIDECGLYSYFTESIPTPTLRLDTPDQKSELALLQGAIRAAEEHANGLRHERRAAFRNWFETGLAELSIPGRVGNWDFESYQEGKLNNSDDVSHPATSPPANHLVQGRHGLALRLTGDDEMNTSVGNFSRDDPFSISLWTKIPSIQPRMVVLHRSRAWTDAGSRGYEWLLEDGKLSASLIHFWPGNSISIRTRETVPLQTWSHLAMTYDGSSSAAGLRLYLHGKQVDTEIVRDGLTKNITGGGGDYLTIGARFRDRGFQDGWVDDLQVFSRTLSSLEVSELFDSATFARQLEYGKTPWEQLEPAQIESLYEYYLLAVDDLAAQQRKVLHELRTRRTAFLESIPEIMVMRELSPRKPTYVLRRGAYDAPTTLVTPTTPAELPQPTDVGQLDRLSLARWLMSSDHPLTSRVAVNRFWQLCFGRGVVRTQEDFGSQGEPPSHPELLDWIAHNFMARNWDTKWLMKTLVTSATYRQSSQPSQLALQVDPDNRWYSRSHRYRLTAEMIRDQLLYQSGLLVERIGGEPVRPYEVSVSFKPVAHEDGAGLYRRSVYTFWKRTGPAPVMMAFDAAKRDICVVRRERTSTPLQALVLLNDPQLIEASRALAQNHSQWMGQESFWVASMFQQILGRTPTAAEQEIVVSMWREQVEHFGAHPAAAQEFLAVGKQPVDHSLDQSALAASTVVAEALFNLDACVTKP